MSEIIQLGFKNRKEAGRRLATLLRTHVQRDEILILALPRGGVPVAAEIAKSLGVPFDILLVRKIGVPHHAEFAMGAIASGGVRVLNHELIAELGLGTAEVDAVVARESRELTRRESLYRGTRAEPQIAGRTIILVDDGIATGSTMSAAIQLLKRRKAASIIVAAPIAAKDAVARLRAEADEVVVALEPEPFIAVGRWYDEFPQTGDAEVQQLLAKTQTKEGENPAATHKQILRRLRQHANPIRGAAEDYDGLLELIGDARIVLLGEATHGTHEFYVQRARITKRLIKEHGFNAVAVEADWPDACRVNRYVRGQNRDPGAIESLAGFNRFPAWMWRNAEVLDFIGWLRSHNDQVGIPSRQVGFHGLDLYSLHKSMNEVIAYLERTDADEARNAKELYGCLDRYGPDPQNYGLLASSGVGEDCRNEVLQQLLMLQEKKLALLARDGAAAADDFFVASQNARIVKNAEAYYRTMFRSDVSSWNLRDQHMMETLTELIDYLQTFQQAPRVVVWAHNSHLGDARATRMSRRGELNLGQLVRQRFPYHSKLIGFTTHTGTVAAASGWHLPVERKAVRNSLDDSYENLFHLTGIPNFWLDLNHGTVREALGTPRLQRAIGVVYHPHSERQSHYFLADLRDQFDAVLHFDQTRAVEPLEHDIAWPADEAPETFPAGL